MAELKKREGEGLLGKEGRELAILLFPLVFGVLSAALGLALPRTHVGRVVAHELKACFSFSSCFSSSTTRFQVSAALEVLLQTSRKMRRVQIDETE